MIVTNIVIVENHGLMEVAYGMGKNTILFYISESEDEDIKIGYPTEHEIECTSSNTVPIDKGIEVLETYLREEEFMVL